VRPDFIRAHQKRKKLEYCSLNLRIWQQSELKTGNVGVFQMLLRKRGACCLFLDEGCNYFGKLKHL